MSAGYVRVLAFGPIAEAIGSRTTKVEWRENLSIEEIIVELDMGHWLGQGLAVALNGERCPVDVHCQRGDEVALLPRVGCGGALAFLEQFALHGHFGRENRGGLVSVGTTAS